MADRPVVVIGAGIAGLSASLRLLARGRDVVMVEGGDAPGGKMRQVATAAGPVDSGPTVFTMRSVFEELLGGVGLAFDDVVGAQPLELLARHAWDDSARLDLYADRARSADAIGVLAGAREASGYLAFCREAGRIFDLLEPAMLRSSRPSPLSLAWRARGAGLSGLLGLKPFTTLWRALGRHFRDPRLQQLFGRYATYCGSSPWQAPATLMLIAHLEQEGVWQLDGGMQGLASGLATAARRRGADLVLDDWVSEIETRAGQVSAVRTAGGRSIECAAVVCTADPGALREGRLGEAARRAVPGRPRQRSLSAITWSMAAEASGFQLAYHNVFFSADYRREFEQLFGREELPGEPTVYLCAQDRAEGQAPTDGRAERIFCLVNAPPTGDRHVFTAEEIAGCQQRMLNKLEDCGLRLTALAEPVVRSPSDFAARFPGSGGAIYGQATHGWRAAFQRPGSRTRLPGLYLAGGGVHPGAGVPMVALSGILAADSLAADRPSTRRLWSAATAGGTSTR